MRVHLSMSRYGVAFVPILMGMLLAAINYDNNLVYIILFLLIGIMAVSAAYTYRNLARLEVRPGNIWPAYAGGNLRYTVQTFNRAPYPIYGITFRREGIASDFRVECDHLEPGTGRAVEFIEPAHMRGRYRISGMEVASIFPLGLFRASMQVPMDWEYVVYPHPKGQRARPDTQLDVRTQDDGLYRGGENFYGLRNYQPGESQRHIDWKAVARGRPLMSKEFASGGTGRLWFDWDQLPNLDIEERLSQLALWVVEADQLGSPYGLRLPQQECAPSTGPIHLQKCLTLLATQPGVSS